MPPFKKGGGLSIQNSLVHSSAEIQPGPCWKFLNRAPSSSCTGVIHPGSWLCSLPSGSLTKSQSSRWPREYSGLLVLPLSHPSFSVKGSVCVCARAESFSQLAPCQPNVGGLTASFRHVQSLCLPAQVVSVYAGIIL